ncbi:MAG TPA: DUF2282 domain-containing protein [Variovorax sp.]|nr:DUF2282 domain-containing protein [Variovorax sp.]
MAADQRPFANALVGGVALLAALAAVQRYTHLLPGAAQAFELPRERCYGIARAGQNDCGTSAHACAAQATRDAAEVEWLSLPSGTCRKLAGGMLLR